MEIECGGIPRLTISQPGELFAVAEQKLNGMINTFAKMAMRQGG
jgi:hypothetical protein